MTAIKRAATLIYTTNFVLEFVNYTKDAPGLNTQSDLPTPNQGKKEHPVDTSGVDLDELMSRIRHVVLTNRRRVI